MKTVFNNQEIAHAFVNQTDAEIDGLRSGRGSNFRFDGPRLFSYATQIAHIYRNKAGARLVLQDSHSFSPSTCKHQNYLRRAERPSDLNVSAPFGKRGQYLPNEGLAIWEACKAAAVSYVDKASRARSNGPYLLEAAQRYIANAEKVRVFFKLRNKPFAPDLDALALSMKEEAKKAAEREAKRVEKRAEFASEFGPVLLDLWRTHRDVLENPEWETLYKRAKALGVRFHYSDLIRSEGFAGTSALRLSVDGSRVETSQGAQVLVRTVRFLWEFCRHAKATRTAWDSETLRRFPRLDNYSANAIDAGGNLTAGCHRIPFAEIEGIARALNLPPFDGSPAEAPTIPQAEEVHA